METATTPLPQPNTKEQPPQPTTFEQLPNKATVKLISSDGFEFILPKECALGSGTLRSMLQSSGQFEETITNEVHLREIKAQVLERVVQYLIYKNKYSQQLLSPSATVTGSGSTQTTAVEIPEFKIDPEIALELLMASDFLDC